VPLVQLVLQVSVVRPVVLEESDLPVCEESAERQDP